jgi:hypothetical protein
LTKIPKSAIINAKEKLIIAYGHASHGSQLTDGMTGLFQWTHGGSLYSWNADGSGGALELHDYYKNFGGADMEHKAHDLGNPNRTAWADATREYLETHPKTNVIIWSWCGQADTSNPDHITTYLTLMSGLETEYPNVKFVYMTGHLAGTGKNGNLNQRNEQIRNYCRNHNKIGASLFQVGKHDTIK